MGLESQPNWREVMQAASKILTKAQAEAVHSAMCALNNVGGQIKASVQLCTVEEIGGRWIVVTDHTTGQREEYDGQYPFVAAYSLQ